MQEYPGGSTVTLTVTPWQHLTEEIQEEEVWNLEYSEPNTFLV